mmetsp:Transcript_24514/g.33564  ORF Transcript_24514/g.33564 Transcript_24514/m.33564 type:complete len:111 (+) Transcript_24514:1115-1447(+)
MGEPMEAMRRSVGALGGAQRIGTLFRLSSSNKSTSANADDTFVAIAAPATPIAGMNPGMPQIKIGSKTELKATDPAVTSKGAPIWPIPLKPAAATPDAMSGNAPEQSQRR